MPERQGPMGMMAPQAAMLPDQRKGEQQPSQYYGMSHGYRTRSVDLPTGIMGHFSQRQPMQQQQGWATPFQRPTGLFNIRPGA
jgi:hypothetical protein